jgi:hypothetical protein
MEEKFQDLPNWTFWVDEISVGVYKVKGKEDVFGASLDLTGQDPQELLREARRTAADMDKQIRRKLN